MWLRLYAYGLLGSLYLDMWLWFVYLLHLGYSPAQIGIAYAIMQAVRFMFDVPSSMLADRFGQRPVLVVASVLKGVSSLLFLLAGRGLGFVIAGSAITAFALTLPSGVDLSFVRSLSERSGEIGAEAGLQLRLSRFMSMQTLATVFAGVLGGAIATISYSLLYQTDAALSLLAAGLALTLPNIRPHRVEDATKRTWYAPAKQALREITGGTVAARSFWQLAAFIIPLWALSSVATEYTQALFQRVGLQPVEIALAFTLASGIGWIGNLMAGRIPERRRSSALRISVWLYPLASAVRAFAVPGSSSAVFAGIAGMGAARFGTGICNVLTNTALLERAPTGHSATALSAVNMIQMAGMMVLFPALGLVADAKGVWFAFVLLAGGLAIVAGGMQFGLRGNIQQRSPDVPA
jgi:MFS family permease